MRILFLCNLFYPEDLGGGRYPLEVATRLFDRGHSVTVVASRPQSITPVTRRGPAMSAQYFYPALRLHPALTLLSHVIGAALTLPRLPPRRYDVLLAGSYDVALGALALPAWRALPLVFTYHSEFYSTWVQRQRHASGFARPMRAIARGALALMRWAERHVFAHSNRIVAVSDYSQSEVLERVPGAAPRIRVIPTGVDTRAFTPPTERTIAKERLGFDPGVPLIIGVGRLTPVKRFDRLLTATAEMLRQGERVQVALVGDGPDAGDLRRCADQLGITSSVRFAGFQDGDGVRAFMQAADVQVCSSEFEHTSLAILEALACGTPVLGTPTGGTPAILEQVDPRLVLPGSEPADIAGGIRRLLQDLDALRMIGSKGREVVQRRYDWDVIVTELEEALSEVAVRGLGTAVRRPNTPSAVESTPARRETSAPPRSALS